MVKEQLTVPQQVKIALDGRTNRWLALEVNIAETDLSKKMNGVMNFSDDEIERINSRLKSSIKK